MIISPFEKASLLKSIERLWEHTNSVPCQTPCQACQFYGKDGVCRQADSEPIPKHVLPKGCDSWKFNPEAMPF